MGSIGASHAALPELHVWLTPPMDRDPLLYRIVAPKLFFVMLSSGLFADDDDMVYGTVYSGASYVDRW